MIKHLKDRKLKGKVVADLSHIANSYALAHRPTVAHLKKVQSYEVSQMKPSHRHFKAGQRKWRCDNEKS